MDIKYESIIKYIIFIIYINSNIYDRFDLIFIVKNQTIYVYDFPVIMFYILFYRFKEKLVV